MSILQTGDPLGQSEDKMSPTRQYSWTGGSAAGGNRETGPKEDLAIQFTEGWNNKRVEPSGARG